MSDCPAYSSYNSVPNRDYHTWIKDLTGYDHIIPYLQSKHINLPANIGALLGHGLEGEIYTYPDNKIIKISLLKHHWAKQLDKITELVESNPSPCLAVIYQHGNLGTVPTTNGDMNAYYYIAEKMLPLSQDEMDQINHPTNVTSANVDTFFKCLRQTAKTDNIEFLDVHSGNVMKNEQNQLKLVDFGFIDVLSNQYNAWKTSYNAYKI